ncbi:MAG: C40 family peptidase [Desulfobaccales bacterium]|nr:C40 family peptidase [Desulfobaccales bacterium]
MAAGSRRLAGVVWLAALLLAGCAGAPPPRAVEPLAPPPQVLRSQQELALERALSEFSGAPYRSGGTTPTGVDCSGLVQTVFQRAGLLLPRTVAEQFSEGRPVGPGELRFGDVVFFNRYCQMRGRELFTAGILSHAYADQACHNGIYLGQGRFIHASPRGVFVSRLDAETWRISFMGARRYLLASNRSPD